MRDKDSFLFKSANRIYQKIRFLDSMHQQFPNDLYSKEGTRDQMIDLYRATWSVCIHNGIDVSTLPVPQQLKMSNILDLEDSDDESTEVETCLVIRNKSVKRRVARMQVEQPSKKAKTRGERYVKRIQDHLKDRKRGYWQRVNSTVTQCDIYQLRKRTKR